jgi:steroid 5-alpha reductase family enzyme
MAHYLMFRNRHHSSTGQKFMVLLMLILAICIAVWQLLFKPGTEAETGNFYRQIILIMCGFIYLTRLVFTMFVFLRRRISWPEALPISVLMSLALYGFIYIGGINAQPLNIMDFTGVVLYLTGSYVNTVSELKRYQWKSGPQNQGRLYTGGLFKRVRHINYFGDMMLFFGFALITHDMRALYIPFFMALNFVFILIPAKEAYLKAKYGKDFEEYSRRSKKLIPTIY